MAFMQSEEWLNGENLQFHPRRLLQLRQIRRFNVQGFVTDEDGMKSFVSGKNALMKPIYDECIESTQLWDLSEISL